MTMQPCSLQHIDRPKVVNLASQLARVTGMLEGMADVDTAFWDRDAVRDGMQDLARRTRKIEQGLVGMIHPDTETVQ